jgi:hypothetical protein
MFVMLSACGQSGGKTIPLTHFLRVMRGITLREMVLRTFHLIWAHADLHGDCC